jgi:hypothetical protein
LTLTIGFLDFFEVERAGSGLFRPQSPFANDDRGVMIDALIGWGSVAVSDPWGRRERFSGWTCIACGRENRRDLRSRFAAGDMLAVAMLIEDG